MIMGTLLSADGREAPKKTVTASSRFGILVFMQYEEGPPGVREALPRPSIDTGLGLERFAAILQGKHDNYDTDTFRALILASAEATGTGTLMAHSRPATGWLRTISVAPHS